MKAKPEDIDVICRSLPEVELGTSWGGQPTYKVPTGAKGRGFVSYRAPGATAVDPLTGKLFDDLLVISVPDDDAKSALVQDPDSPFFTIDHFTGYSSVLVQQSRLGELDREELAEVLIEAWACKAPNRLAMQYFEGRE